MQISLTSKGDAGNTCPYCRDTIGSGEGRRCKGCKTTLHRECADELHKCPTTGCGRSLTQRAPSRRSADRVMIGGRNRTQTAEMSPAAQKALGVGVVALMLFGVWAAIPSDKPKRGRKSGTSTRRSGMVKLVFGRDQAVIRRHMPKYVVRSGPPWQLQLEVRETDGTRMKLMVEPGTTFSLNGSKRQDYLAVRRTEFVVQDLGQRHNIPVVPLRPVGWRLEPPGNYQPTSPDSSQASALGMRWQVVRAHSTLEAEAVAALWYLGHHGKLRPPPEDGVVRAANQVLVRLGRKPYGSAPTPSSTPRSGPRRSTLASPSPTVKYMLRQYSFHPTRRLNFKVVFRNYRANRHVHALVQKYLKSDLVQVRWEAFRWLSANLVVDANDLALHAQLFDRDRLRRLLALFMLIRRGKTEYEPLRLIYARDAWVDPERFRAFGRTYPDLTRRLAAGDSPFILWVQRVGFVKAVDLRLKGVGQRLYEDEERYVAQAIRGLRAGTGRSRTMRAFSHRLSQYEARFRHHPLLWDRLHELCGDSSPWVRQLALNSASRLSAGGRILAKVVANPRYVLQTRLEAVHHARYLSLPDALRVGRAAARGPAKLQAAVVSLVRKRRDQLRSPALKTQAGELLSTLIGSRDAQIAQRALALLIQLELSGVRAVLKKSLNDPAQAERVIKTITTKLTAHSKLAREVAGDLRGFARYEMEARVRLAALRGAAVYEASDPVRFRQLLEHVVARDVAPMVRSEAVAIAAKHVDRYLALLLGRLTDDDATVRRAAVTGLRSSTRRSVHRKVQKIASHDTDRDVRRAAYDVVRRWSSSQARQVALDWAKRKELEDQRLAVTVMTRDFPTSGKIRAKLRSFERHPDAWIRNHVREFFRR